MPDYAWSNARPMAIGMRPVHWLIYYVSHLIPNYYTLAEVSVELQTWRWLPWYSHKNDV